METLKHIMHQVSALNDLIRINNDRITGYKKRMGISLDDDLDDLFAQFIFQSQQNIEELTQYIYLLGGKPADGSTLSGKFYHGWMDFSSAINRQSRQTLLDYCEYGEDVAKSTYKKALDDKEMDWGTS
ncbi:MAG TPA: PA2169 family four-helix-bundle protein, partial [Mucilaginibacter sp.]